MAQTIEKAQRRRGPATAKALAVAFGLAAGVLLAELASRLAYSRPWYESLIDAQVTGELISPARNSWGLRDREYATPKPASTRRVLLLGDSFTYGAGVPDDDAIFPRLLEKALAEERSSEVGTASTIEVLNGGQGGSLTSDWVRLLERVGPVFQPDVVIAVFFLRDGTRTTAREGFFFPLRDGIVRRNQANWFYRNSYMVRIFQDQLDRRTIGESYTREIRQSYFGSENETEEWRLAKENLRRIQLLARAQGATTGLVIFPILAELDDSYPFRDVCDEVSGFGEGLGMSVHSLLPAFLGHDASTLWVSPADQHPNPQGHRIAAASLLPFVDELLVSAAR